MNIRLFQGVLVKYTLRMLIPFGLLFVLLIINRTLGYDILKTVNWNIGGLPVIVTNGTTNMTGFAGLGIISIGGLAVGFLAIGGGAFGIIAIGGGGCGYYMLSGGGLGKYVLTYDRQDLEAVRFFRKYFALVREVYNENPRHPTI